MRAVQRRNGVVPRITIGRGGRPGVRDVPGIRISGTFGPVLVLVPQRWLLPREAWCAPAGTEAQSHALLILCPPRILIVDDNDDDALNDQGEVCGFIARFARLLARDVPSPGSASENDGALDRQSI